MQILLRKKVWSSTVDAIHSFAVICLLFRFTPDRLDPAKVYDAGGRGRPQTNAEL